VDAFFADIKCAGFLYFLFSLWISLSSVLDVYSRGLSSSFIDPSPGIPTYDEKTTGFRFILVIALFGYIFLFLYEFQWLFFAFQARSSLEISKKFIILKKNSELIFGYFPRLTDLQRQQIDALEDNYKEWNSKINVISRKDIDSLYLRHVLHSLAIAKYVEFKPGEKILDVGTGGGFPGLPLAILFPETDFLLVDSIGKKIKVVNEIAATLGLTNVVGRQARAESIEGKFNFIVSRAVTQLKDFYPWVRNKIKKESNNSVPNGILYLKGGDLDQEIKESGLKPELIAISDYFSEDFFDTKYILHIPVG